MMKALTSLETLLDHFFRIINPFSLNRQGHDIGRQYRTGIYYIDPEDATRIIDFMNQHFGLDIKKVRTEVKLCLDYELAEEYHQDYLKKNPNGYCHVDMGLAAPEEKK
jgi:peptide-methionine (S)-S-oxide reductase